MSRKIRVDDKQFDVFWEVKCPHCGKKIELEIIVNLLTGKIEVKNKKH